MANHTDALQTPTPLTTEHFQTLVGLLQNMNQRFDSVEARLNRLDRLGEHLDHPLPTFPQFRRLPPELRCRIWDFAIPRRKLRHYSSDDSQCLISGRALPTSGLPPPIISRVCRESRSVAKKHGAGMFPLRRGEENDPYWSWFDGAHDILELGTPRCAMLEDWDGGCEEILSHAREILVHLHDIKPHWVRAMFHNNCVRETLKVINIQRCRSEPVTKGNWDPYFVSRLFSQDTVVVVDVRDPDEVEGMRAILSDEHPLTDDEGPEFILCVDAWQNEEHSFRAIKDDKRPRHSMAWAEHIFKRAWLREFVRSQQMLRPRHEKKNLKDAKTEGKESEPDSAPGMPCVRFVYTMELGEDGRLLGDEDVLGKPWSEFLSTPT